MQPTTFSVLFMISAAHFLNDMMQSIIPAVYPIIKEDFGFTFTQIGVITFTFQIASSLLQPVIGFWTDIKPKPFSLATGMCFTLTGLLALASASHFYAFLAAVTLIGIGSSVFHPEASKVALMFAGNKKGLAQSIFQVGGNAGKALGPLLAAFVVIPFGQSYIVLFAFAALTAMFILIKVGIRYKSRVAASAKIGKSPLAQTNIRPILTAKQIKLAFLVLLILMFSKDIYMACMTNYFTFFLIDKFNISVEYSQYCLFIFLAASAAGTIIGGSLGDRFGRKYVIWGSILGSAPFAVVLPYAGFIWVVVLAVIVALIMSSAFSAILVYAVEMLPERAGVTAGIFFGLSFGMAGIGSAFFGWLADITSVKLIFQISAFLPFIGLIATFLPNMEKR